MTFHGPLGHPLNCSTFNTYWNILMPLGSKTSMANPFLWVKTDGFWHLEPNPGIFSR
ncbi:MAG: hypothetical protein JRF58_13690 [Deltaproteobacteria bacterium]|nr:hypothetical protein [Deltaproteobacteria bacterium]